MVDAVLKGTATADLPIVQFKTDLSIYVNKATLEALELTLPSVISDSEQLVMMEQE